MAKSCPFQTSWRFDPTLLDISNIKKLIPLVLDLEKAEYRWWSTLFRVTARACNLIHHIDARSLPHQILTPLFGLNLMPSFSPGFMPPSPLIYLWQFLMRNLLPWILGHASEICFNITTITTLTRIASAQPCTVASRSC